MEEVDGILVAAYELKSPLATLRQLALSFDDLGSEGEKIRAEMVAVSERAIRQVNDLAKIRRLSEGLFEMEPVAVRGICDEVTREVLGLFEEGRSEGQAARARLKIKYSNRSRLVTANRELLSSVVYNFLTSATHYAELTNEAAGDEAGFSELSVSERRGFVRVEVRDFGPALPRDVWREMRSGFIERPTSIAMRPGTSGLGLYIASKFAKYMSARVGAVRHRDGTSFYVELPVSKQTSFFEAGV